MLTLSTTQDMPGTISKKTHTDSKQSHKKHTSDFSVMCPHKKGDNIKDNYHQNNNQKIFTSHDVTYTKKVKFLFMNQ